MKTLLSIFSAFTLLFIFSSVRAETADEIISKHIAAIGGKDAWKKITSVKIEGTLTAQGTEIPVSITKVHNKGYRNDISMMGMNGYSIITPTTGWNYYPFGGQQKPEAITADDLKQSQDELDAQGELIDYSEKGHSAEYIGKEDMEGTECYKLKLTLKNGKVKTLFFDPSNYYLIREVSKIKANGQEGENTVNFSNFQKLPEGIVVPMTIGTGFGEVKVTKCQINGKIEDSIFKVDTK